MFVNVDHPIAGRIRVSGRPIKFPNRSQPPMAPAPLHGQHSREIVMTIAGRTSEEVLDLERNGVIRQAAKEPNANVSP